MPRIALAQTAAAAKAMPAPHGLLAAPAADSSSFEGLLAPSSTRPFDTPSLDRPLATRIIDHGAIARNVARVIGTSATPLMAVVKADAFGHGAVEVARTVLAAGASWLGVATVAEAIQLRRAGIVAPILAWLVDPWSNLEEAVRRRITLSAANVETLAAIVRVTATITASTTSTATAASTATMQATAVANPAQVHLELDTGMARGGSTPELWEALCAAAAIAERNGTVTITGVWSHLALASLPTRSSVAHPVAAFHRGLEIAFAAGLDPANIHLANSAAALAHPVARFTMVRSGAALYGIETVHGRSFGLEPAQRLVSRVTQLREASAGTGIGYLHERILAAPATLALVPVGYGDGVPRTLSHGGEVSIGGRRYPIRGAISMDQLVVEVDGDLVTAGDEVVLLGDARAGEPDVAEWAALAATIPHDILCGLGARLQRDHAGTRPYWSAA
jgi:alanine racemase